MSGIPVLLTIRSKQSYEGQEPDTIELVTEGTLEHSGTAWVICYEESDLTGLEGVTTVFRISRRGAVIRRTGRLHSRMIFREGVRHESLFEMEMGALMMCVTAQKIRYDLSESGGTVDITYAIEIENASVGLVEYHLQVSLKN